jgi:hypothetical protein
VTVRVVAQFLLAFACVFAGLALPSRGLGSLYTRAHTALGNALVQDLAFASGARLQFSHDLAERPWQSTLTVRKPGQRTLAFPIELRTLSFLPLVTFVALAVAAPLSRPRRNVAVLGAGLVVLVPLLLASISLPLIAVLGGLGPIRLFSLSDSTRLVVDVLHRVFVAPPGMAYAVPLLLFWALLGTVGKAPAFRTPSEAAQAQSVEP